MQDNAPCHTSKVSKNYLNKTGMEILDWPPQSPDLNPIENIWAIIKDLIWKRRHYIDNLEDLKSEIETIFYSDYIRKIIKNCYASLKSRFEEGIKMAGAPINY